MANFDDSDFKPIKQETGTFDTSDFKPVSQAPAPSPVSPKPAPQQPSGLLSDIGQGFKKGVSDIAKGPEVAIPEAVISAGRLAGRALEPVTDIVGAGAKAAYGVLPESLRKGVESNVVAPIKQAASTVGQAYQKYVPESMKPGLEKTAQTAQALGNILPFVPAAKAEEAIVSGVGKLTKGALEADEARIAALPTEQKMTHIANYDRDLSNTVEKTTRKAIRPTVVGKETSGQIKNYYNKATDTVKSIVEYKDGLKLTDAEGNVIQGELPKNLLQYGEAIPQVKQSIFNKYDAMKKAAGEQGAIVPLSPIVSELKSFASNKAMKDAAPDVAKYAEDLAETYKTRGHYTPEDMQSAIAIYNDRISAFKKFPSPESANKITAQAMVVNLMRKGLDDAITSEVGPGYQALKKQYGALKAMEKDVNHRAQIFGRQNSRGLIDFSDIFTAGEAIKGTAELLKGISTGGTSLLKSAGMYIVKSATKAINNPDRRIAGMFEDAEKIIGRSEKIKGTIPKEVTPIPSESQTPSLGTTPTPAVPKQNWHVPSSPEDMRRIAKLDTVNAITKTGEQIIIKGKDFGTLFHKGRVIAADVPTEGYAGGGEVKSSNQLRPAIRANSKTYIGKVGDNHDTILTANNIKDGKRGFVNSNGKFMNRQESMAYLKNSSPEMAKHFKGKSALYTEIYNESLGLPAKKIQGYEQGGVIGEIHEWSSLAPKERRDQFKAIRKKVRSALRHMTDQADHEALAKAWHEVMNHE